MSSFQYEANKLKARSDLYQKLANLDSMLFFMHPASGDARVAITIFGNTLELSSLRDKHPELAAIIESEIRAKIEEIKYTLATKEFP